MNNDHNNVAEEFLNLFTENLAKAAEERDADMKEGLKRAAEDAYMLFESFMDAGFSRMEAFVLMKEILLGGEHGKE